MGKTTKIDWCDATWNPWYGCTKVSEGCRNCYMHRWAKRAGKDPNVVQWAADATFYAPLKWKEPRRIMVCSLSDFFHEAADEWREKAFFEVMLMAPQHTYIIPTKRTNRLLEVLNDQLGLVESKNIWILASVENQEAADKRIPELLKLREYGYWPVLGLSVEPILEEIHIEDYLFPERKDGIDWVIVGAESGTKRRPCAMDWVRSLRDQCHTACVPIWIKQLHINGRLERDINKFPADLQIREYPK